MKNVEKVLLTLLESRDLEAVILSACAQFVGALVSQRRYRSPLLEYARG